VQKTVSVGLRRFAPVPMVVAKAKKELEFSIRSRDYMKYRYLLVVLACILGPTVNIAGAQSGNTGDYPLLSEGSITPPPPPPGYSFALPQISPATPPPPPPGNVGNATAMPAETPAAQPQTSAPMVPPPAPVEAPASSVPADSSPVADPPPFSAPPAPPVLPPSPPPAAHQSAGSGSADVPDSARFNQQFVTSAPAGQRVMQLITADLANQIKRLLRSLKTMRTIVDKPESAEELRRIQLSGRVCADLLGLKGFPVPSRFVASGNDKVLRDRSHDAVEYRFYGDFDNRLNGWIKPIKTAVYVDLVFDGRSRRRTHVRAQFTRTGTMTGSFYAYSWDAFGNPWKMQGSLENLFVHDDGLPAGGSLKVFGADPAGKTIGLALDFPVKVHGENGPEKADTRHREGKRVSIGR